MENKKQTAVEWLVEKLKSQGLLIGEIDNLVAVKQANKMFEEQIIDACQHGVDYDKSPYNNAEQYYNETYGTKG